MEQSIKGAIKAQDAEKQYVMAHSDKKIMWLVKIEYHT